MPHEIWFDKYRIIKLLGRGGTAEVYLAEHIKLSSFRAIKHISKHHPLYKLQLKEAHILKDLKHPCIPIIYDIEEDENGSYIVEQYLEGVTLKEYVSVRGFLIDDIIVHFALQICDLINYLHSVKRPILYLDLKPDNIIVTNRTIRLIDFGSAMFRDEADKNAEYYGTIGYAAPELYDKGGLDERCDVYGIGMLLYFMFTGKNLSSKGGKTEHIDFMNTGSNKLKRIISRCLRFEPSQRYSSVSRLEQQLSAIMKRKKQIVSSGSSIEIGIAGAQSRIGTTHMSFRLCSYFSKQDLDCLYIEQNKSRCLWLSSNRYTGLNNRDIIKMKGISMICAEHIQVTDISRYNVIVRDYGRLTTSNKEQFLKSEIKLLILGAKDWELGFSEEALELVSEYKEIIFLFNFVDGRQFRQVIQGMMFRNCLRVPYEPDPFAVTRNRNSQDFFRELLAFCSK